MQIFGKLVLISPDSAERSFELAKTEITIGSDQSNDIALDDGNVSHTHVRIECSENECMLIDNNSINGTLLNGQPVRQATLSAGDVIKMGNNMLRFDNISQDKPALFDSIDSMSELETTVAQQSVRRSFYETSRARLVVYSPDRTWDVQLVNETLSIGRSPEADIPLLFEKVSRHHAQIERRDNEFIIRDLGSTNGTWFGSQSVKEHVFRTGDTIKIGPAFLMYKDAYTSADLTLIDQPVIKPTSGVAHLPVVFVPGFMGSELWAGSERVWPNMRVLFSNPEIFALPDKAHLKPKGIVNDVVIVPNLIKQEQYGRLGNYLVRDLGYKRGEDLIEFSYDWRQDVRESARQLAATIADWKVAGPVVIIAHSLGSLVSRYYIECLGGRSKVAQAIFLGGPHYGVTESIINLIMKADLLPFGLLGDRVRDVVATFPSFYQILPIYNCTFDQHGNPVNVFEDDSWLPEDKKHLLRAARQFRHELGRRLSVPSVSVFGYGIKTVSRIDIHRNLDGAWSKITLDSDGSGDSSIPEASTVLEGSEIHPVKQYHGSLYVDNDVRMRLKLELTGQRRRA